MWLGHICLPEMFGLLLSNFVSALLVLFLWMQMGLCGIFRTWAFYVIIFVVPVAASCKWLHANDIYICDNDECNNCPPHSEGQLWGLCNNLRPSVHSSLCTPVRPFARPLFRRAARPVAPQSSTLPIIQRNWGRRSGIPKSLPSRSATLWPCVSLQDRNVTRKFWVPRICDRNELHVSQMS